MPSEQRCPYSDAHLREIAVGPLADDRERAFAREIVTSRAYIEALELALEDEGRGLAHARARIEALEAERDAWRHLALCECSPEWGPCSGCSAARRTLEAE